MTFLYNAFSKRPILTIILGKMAGVWTSFILAFWGDALTLTYTEVTGDISNPKTSRYFSWYGLIITIVVLLLPAFIAIVEKYNEMHSDTPKIIAERDFLKSINVSAINISKKKINNQLTKIQKIRDEKKLIPYIYTKPCEQINAIMDELLECLSYMVSDNGHRLNKDNFKASLLYNFPLENSDSWQLANSCDPNMLTVEQITSPNTTFSYLLESGKPYVYFNNKQKAFEEHHYIKSDYEETDRNGRLKGSIACFHLVYGNHTGNYINAVLSISTNNKQIIDESNYIKKNKNSSNDKLEIACENLYSNIHNNLINNFRGRIGVELCNYYIQFLRKKYNKKRTKNSQNQNPISLIEGAKGMIFRQI